MPGVPLSISKLFSQKSQKSQEGGWLGTREGGEVSDLGVANLGLVFSIVCSTGQGVYVNALAQAFANSIGLGSGSADCRGRGLSVGTRIDLRQSKASLPLGST